MKALFGQTVNWRNEQLLHQALTHRSMGKRNNERLEFLGDSILSLVTTHWLYTQFSQLSEGEMSRIRSSLVSGRTLARVARHYGLGEHIRLGAGEIKSGGADKSSVLADAVEAIFGAVYLDQGFAFAQQFVENTMQAWYQKVNPEKINKDNKSALQEVLQKHGLPTPTYETLQEEELADHSMFFEVACRVPDLQLSTCAEAASRKRAEQGAAEKMLAELPFKP